MRTIYLVRPEGGSKLTSAPSLKITGLLHAWSSGDQNAFAQLIDIVYPDLRRIAQHCLGSERPGHTIQATALVHEAWIQLTDFQRIHWQDRAHFLAVSARIMRHILVDYARAQDSAKRGGRARRVDLREALVVSSELGPELVEVDQALNELAKFDARKAQVVEMRYFGGLTALEIASVLDVSPQSVSRDWNLAKAWLAREMTHKRSRHSVRQVHRK
jgi:RNA polymerase sigma factor (TIGR02999 family)